MGRAIGQVIPLGIGVALSPLPVIAVILMLNTPRGRVTGPSFLAGWVLALAGLAAVVLLVADEANAGEAGGAKGWVTILKALLGVLLIVVAWRQWRARPRDGELPELPGWMQKVESFTPARAAAVAAAFAAVKPKNLLLTIAAGTAVAQTSSGAGTQATALLVFVVVASMGIGAPVAIGLVMGDRSERLLADLRDWMVRWNTTIVAVICLVLAVKLIADAIAG